MAKRQTIRFAQERLVRDLGGEKAVSQLLGVGRTEPYRWTREANPVQMSVSTLAKIKAVMPSLDLDYYFEAVYE